MEWIEAAGMCNTIMFVGVIVFVICCAVYAIKQID